MCVCLSVCLLQFQEERDVSSQYSGHSDFQGFSPAVGSQGKALIKMHALTVGQDFLLQQLLSISDFSHM